MADKDKQNVCSSCGGELQDYDDYIFNRALKVGLSAAPVAAVICGIWAPLFFLARLTIGGALGHAGAGVLLVLLLKKVFAGAVVGVLIGAAVGIGRDEAGLLLGAVIGSLAGFFFAACDAMPLLSDAAHRMDIVLVALISGILCTATVYFTNGYVKKNCVSFTGPEPVEKQ